MFQESTHESQEEYLAMVADGELLTYQVKTISNSAGVLFQHLLPREFRIQPNEVIFTYQKWENPALDLMLQVTLEQELEKLPFVSFCTCI